MKKNDKDKELCSKGGKHDFKKDSKKKLYLRCTKCKELKVRTIFPTPDNPYL